MPISGSQNNTEERWPNTLPPAKKHDIGLIKVLVADPFRLFRQAVLLCLKQHDNIEVVAAVATPEAYRKALKDVAFDVAIVASDLMSSTHTTRPLVPGDMLISESEATEGQAADKPTVVLLADEDLEEVDAPPIWEPGAVVDCKRIYIPRGAPTEIVVQAIQAVWEGCSKSTG